MTTLMTREQFSDRIEALRKEHPWVGPSVLRSAPGHLALVETLLRDLEEICGSDKLANRLHFLRIVPDDDGDMTTFIDIRDASPGQSEAINAARKRVFRLSAETCQACGETQSGRRFCPSHQESKVHFAEDVIESTPTNMEEDEVFPPAEEADIDPLAEQMSLVVSEDSRQEVPGPAGPTVTLFDTADVQRLADSARGKESDTKQRIEQLVRRLKATAHVKPLATLPEDWEGRLNGLQRQFPNFAEFIDFLYDQFALSALGDGRLALPPVLFNGPPGIGKTELALTLAEMFATGIQVVDMASAQCGAALSGTEAFWGNTREGDLFETLALGQTANPIVVLDELDKANGDARYRPDAALYQLLEPRTARRFHDLSAKEINLDASHVVWIATSNEAQRLNAPLKSRFVAFEIPCPVRAQTLAIVHAIHARLRASQCWGSEIDEGLDEAVAEKLADLSPRLLRPALMRALGRAARDGRRHLIVQDVVAASARSNFTIGFIKE